MITVRVLGRQMTPAHVDIGLSYDMNAERVRFVLEPPQAEAVRTAGAAFAVYWIAPTGETGDAHIIMEETGDNLAGEWTPPPESLRCKGEVRAELQCRAEGEIRWHSLPLRLNILKSLEDEGYDAVATPRYKQVTLEVNELPAGAEPTGQVTQDAERIAFSLGIPMMKGEKGDSGDAGLAATLAILETVTGLPGSLAALEEMPGSTPQARRYRMAVPGGPQGPAGTLEIGQVTTGAPGTQASVVNAGTPEHAVLHIQLPAGSPGEMGPEGAPGTTATLEVAETVTGDAGGKAAFVEAADSTPLHRKYSVVLPRGDKGESMVVRGVFSSYAALLAAHPLGNVGDVYAVEGMEGSTLYIWGADARAWQNVGMLQGPAGQTGERGAVGFAGRIQVVETITTEPGTLAGFAETEESTDENRLYVAMIPRGERGPAGGVLALSVEEEVYGADAQGMLHLTGDAVRGMVRRHAAAGFDFVEMGNPLTVEAAEGSVMWVTASEDTEVFDGTERFAARAGDSLALRARAGATTLTAGNGTLTAAYSKDTLAMLRRLTNEETSRGTIATLADAVEGLPLQTGLSFIAKQAGEGTPSGMNIRRITGVSRAVVKRCGENLLDPRQGPATFSTGGFVFLKNVDGTLTATGAQEGFAFYDYPMKMTLPKGIYTISAPLGIAVQLLDAEGQIRLLKGSGMERSAVATETDWPITCTRVVVANGRVFENLKVDVFIGVGDVAGVFRSHQTVAVEWAPEAPLYGLPDAADEMDAEGKETHRSCLLTLAGDESGWTLDSTTNTAQKRFRLALPEDGKACAVTGGGTAPNLLSSHYIAMARNPGTYTSNRGVSVSDTGQYLYFYDEHHNTTLEDWRTHLAAQAAAGTPVQVLYERGMPRTYSCRQTPLYSVKGKNHVYSEAGETVRLTGHEIRRGDMARHVYDRDGDGIVDDADRARLSTRAASADMAAEALLFGGKAPDAYASSATAVNGKPLAADITLTAADVGAVTLREGRALPAQMLPKTIYVGESRSLTLEDMGCALITTSDAPIVLTLPPQAAVPWPEGAEILLLQWAGGRVCVIPEEGVSLRGFGTALAGQGAGATLKQVMADGWMLVGGVAEESH